MEHSSESDPAQTQDSIDAVDRQILELVEQRHRLVHRLYESDDKGLVGRVTSASSRIDAIVQAQADATADSIPPAVRAAFLRHLSSVCLQSLHHMKTAYLGPMHSYSHLAAIKYFGDATTLTPVGSIPAVFDAVARGDAFTGIVPIENSTDGRVVDTLGMFVRREMQICGEVLLPIHHNLLSKDTSRRDRRSAQQATRRFRNVAVGCQVNFRQLSLVEISSTAAAAQLASEKHGVAAVASVEAGRQYDLDLIDANIEDNPNNITRFAVLGKEGASALRRRQDGDVVSSQPPTGCACRRNEHF